MVRIRPKSEIHLLEPRFFFGLTIGTSNNCLFLDEDRIIYRASGVIVVHDTFKNTQKFVQLAEPQKIITTMVLNNRKTVLAVAKSGKKPTISLYDMVKFEMIRHVVVPFDTISTYFLKLEFSHDDVYLAALSGEPDYIMFYYNTQKSKIESHVEAIRLPEVVGPVTDMALNPSKNGSVCFVGDKLFRLMNMSEVVWKQYGFQKVKNYHFSSVCWLSSTRVMAGTVDGQLLIVDGGELKAVYHDVRNLTDFNPKRTMINPTSDKQLPEEDSKTKEIRYCTRLKGGVLFVVGRNRVYYYKSNKEGDPVLTRNTVFLMPRDETQGHIEGDDEDPHVINTLSVCPKYKHFVCTSKRPQLYYTSMAGNIRMMDVKMEPFGEPLHQGGVSGLSICQWKPIFVTCGSEDRSVKLWNHAKRSLLLTERYDEDVLCVSLHPRGLYVALSLTSRILYQIIYHEGLETRQELLVAGCQLILFSTDGHLLAVAQDSVLRLYCSVTFTERFVFHTHSNTIIDLTWTGQDWKLYSCDVDGRLCVLDLYAGEQKIIFELTNESLLGIAVTPDQFETYLVSHEGHIRELYHRTVIRDKDLQFGPLNNVCLSNKKKLYVSCHNGAILSLQSPIMSKVNYKAFQMHSQRVSKIRITFDDATFISCSVDGSICIWDVRNSKGKILNSRTILTDEVLISSKYLKHMSEEIAELNLSLGDAIRRRVTDVEDLAKSYENRVGELNFKRYLETKRKVNERKVIEGRYNDAKLRVQNKINDMKKEHDLNCKSLINSYETKIEYEDEKYELLLKRMDESESNLKKESEMALALHEKNVQEVTDKFNSEMKEREEDFKNFKEQWSEDKIKFNKVIDEFEDQNDKEVLEIKADYAAQFKKYSRSLDKMQKNAKQFRNKARSVKKEDLQLKNFIEICKGDINEWLMANKDLDNKIAELEWEINGVKEVTREKEMSIEDTKKEINDTESELLLLEYHKREQMVFMDSLNKTKTKIKQMDINLDRESYVINKNMAKLQLRVNNAQQLMTVAHKNWTVFKHTKRKHNELLKKIRMDLYYVRTDPEHQNNVYGIKRDLRLLYKRYTSADLETAIKSDEYRQRKYLEGVIVSLKKRWAAATWRKPVYVKSVEQNVSLIETINKLKKEREVNRGKYDDLVRLMNNQRSTTNISVDESGSLISETLAVSENAQTNEDMVE